VAAGSQRHCPFVSELLPLPIPLEIPSLQSSPDRRVRMDRYRSPGETRHRRRRRSTVGGTDQIRRSRTRKHETRRPRSEHQSSSSDDDAATQSGSVKDKPTRRRTNVVYVSAAGARSPQKERPRSEAKEHKGGSTRRTRSHRSRRASTAAASPLKRYDSSFHNLWQQVYFMPTEASQLGISGWRQNRLLNEAIPYLPHLNPQ
jgi:hypothetical protein